VTHEDDVRRAREIVVSWWNLDSVAHAEDVASAIAALIRDVRAEVKQEADEHLNWKVLYEAEKLSRSHAHQDLQQAEAEVARCLARIAELEAR
jgi:hypothetical protein